MKPKMKTRMKFEATSLRALEEKIRTVGWLGLDAVRLIEEGRPEEGSKVVAAAHDLRKEHGRPGTRSEIIARMLEATINERTGVRT